MMEKTESTSAKIVVSIIVPAYNEEKIIEKNLAEICSYMRHLENEYQWELVVINDGSTDETGKLAEEFAKGLDNVRVYHRKFNGRLGRALRNAFANSRGDYIIVMDLDLSYSPEHIGRMLAKIRETGAKIVIASPFRKDGEISNVPPMRQVFTRWANRFLSYMATGRLFSDRITNITGMVRAYNGEFIRNLSLRAIDVEINPEIILKATVLRARIDEVPAHLSWRPVLTESGSLLQRKSSLRIRRSFTQSILSGFILRPVKFFILPGLALFIISLYPIAWVIIHIADEYNKLANLNLSLDHRISGATATAFKLFPHAFVVGGIVLMVAVQLISLGFLSFQNKRYFEELYNLTHDIFRKSRSARDFEDPKKDMDS